MSEENNQDTQNTENQDSEFKKYYQSTVENSDNDYQDHTAQYSGESYTASQPQQKSSAANGLQIASMIIGIIGIPTCCCYGIVGLVCGIVSIILAIMGNKRSHSGIGIAGLILGIIATILGIIGLIYYVLIFMGMYYTAGPFYEILKEAGMTL